jgi:hypothetical protein
MRNLISQEQINLGEPLKGIGPLGLEEGQDAVTIFTKFISSAIGLMTVIAIIWFVFVLIMGAIGIISSGGDKASLETARKRITTGIVGLVVVIAAIFIIDLIGRLIGLPDILDLPALFEKIQQ